MGRQMKYVVIIVAFWKGNGFCWYFLKYFYQLNILKWIFYLFMFLLIDSFRFVVLLFLEKFVYIFSKTISLSSILGIIISIQQMSIYDCSKSIFSKNFNSFVILSIVWLHWPLHKNNNKKNEYTQSLLI